MIVGGPSWPFGQKARKNQTSLAESAFSIKNEFSFLKISQW
jgi:hypothetical protein